MSIFANIIIKIIKCYRFLVSPLLGNSCRYLPTCSEYCIESLQTYSLHKALYYCLRRILSCHPIKFLGGGGGFDPIKKKMRAKK